MRAILNSQPTRSARAPAARQPAFTLIELLVVIGIIAVLASTGIPAIRSLSQSNALAASNRQVLDDLAYARHLAISGRRSVYMVFLTPAVRSHFDRVRKEVTDARVRDQLLRQMTNLVTGQYTAYALYTERTVGDQPGRYHPQYLTPWRQLPEGMFFVTNRFVDLGAQWVTQGALIADTNRPLPQAAFRFPSAEVDVRMRMPYIAFSPQGRVRYLDDLEPRVLGETLSISRGSIFYPRTANNTVNLAAAPDIIETPPGNRIDIRVHWLTGRARVERTELR